MKQKERNPWAWIPTLYMAEALPYVAVMTISTIMYKRLGISNTDIALYTGWLYLPWVIKPFWSPFVDLVKTKRWWTVMMQFIIAIGFACIAFSLPTSFFFQLTLAAFWLVAFTSATHDIAADGYYMHALDDHEQSLYVGIRSTFYRIATVAGQGLLVILAGVIEMNSGLEPVQMEVKANERQIEINTVSPVSDDAPCFYFTSMESESPSPSYVKEKNEENGFVEKEEVQTVVEEEAPGWLDQELASFTEWVRETFGEAPREVSALTPRQQMVGVTLSEQPPNDEPVILNIAFKSGDQSISLDGKSPRFEFTKDNWDKQALLLVSTLNSRVRQLQHSRDCQVISPLPGWWCLLSCRCCSFWLLSIISLSCRSLNQTILPRMLRLEPSHASL